jgi:aminomethyltransferase
MPEGALIAIQGPESIHTFENILQEPLSDLPRFGHKTITPNPNLINSQEPIFIARTGYTGEEGFEFLSSPEAAKSIWKRLITSGVTPCGLGARDTLRLEASMHLYGNDINLDTTPFEAGLGWLVHLEMPNDFIGRKALEKQAETGTRKKLVGIKVLDKAIARKGYKVLSNCAAVGIVTSGTWSPTLKEPIALAYVPSEIAKVNTQLEVEIRGKKHPAIIVKKPFYRKGF